MASHVLRQYVYSLLVGAPGLAEAGYDPESISPNFTPDAPTQERFLIIRWGVVTVGIAQVNHVRLSVWAYNRQPDYGPIADALKAVRARLDTLSGGVVMAPGESVLAVRFEGDSDDLYDDGYRAHTRWCSHTITASGS